jgi:hypothetical protein
MQGFRLRPVLYAAILSCWSIPIVLAETAEPLRGGDIPLRHHAAAGRAHVFLRCNPWRRKIAAAAGTASARPVDGIVTLPGQPSAIGSSPPPLRQCGGAFFTKSSANNNFALIFGLVMI